MMYHAGITDSELKNGIKQKAILIGGNRKLKIYGTLKCTSGKRMKRDNRVFFQSEQDAIKMGYRPCGHCMKPAYKKWKDGLVQ